MSVFPRHDTHHLKHTPDLISMQQYANGLDLLVSVSFISPGFFLFLSLSKPCCRSLHPSLLFFLSWQRLHTHTDKLGELIYCMSATAVHVFLYLCASADVCTILISSQ